MSPSIDFELGRIAYDGYCKAAGNEFGSFEDLPEETQLAWWTAAEAVAQTIEENL